MKNFLNRSNRTITFAINEKGTNTDVAVHANEVISLPEDNAHVKGLVAKRLLEETKQEVTPTQVEVITANPSVKTDDKGEKK